MRLRVASVWWTLTALTGGSLTKVGGLEVEIKIISLWRLKRQAFIVCRFNAVLVFIPEVFADGWQLNRFVVKSAWRLRLPLNKKIRVFTKKFTPLRAGSNNFKE